MSLPKKESKTDISEQSHSGFEKRLERNTTASSAFLERAFSKQSLIGRGSFGEVFKASWTEIKKDVALKKVLIKEDTSKLLKAYRSLRSNKLKDLPDMAHLSQTFGKIYNFSKSDPLQAVDVPQERTEPTEKRTRKEMEAEIRIWRKFQQKGDSHYGLLYLHRTIFIESECWLVMELCGKGNLYYFTKNFVYDKMIPLTLDICLEIVTPIIAALKYMHNLGIVHRDVKPENILLNNEFHPKLGDFTLCTEYKFHPILRERTRIKYVDSYSGTPTYSPPESFFAENYNSTWDSWSIICLILFLKFGKVCWNLGGENVSDETIAKFFSESCFEKIELSEDNGENVEHEYLSKMFVVPRNKFVQENSEDDFPWCEPRLEFATFAKKGLSWDLNSRMSCSQILEHDLFVDRSELWDADHHYAAKKLRKKIKNWIEDDTFLDDKWLVF